MINVEKKQFETPKRCTVKNSNTTQDDQIANSYNSKQI